MFVVRAGQKHTAHAHLIYPCITYSDRRLPLRRGYLRGTAVPNVQLASYSAGAPTGGTAGVSSHARTIHHVHTRATCFADGDDHIVLLMEGCEWHSLRE